jgi:hypothetical protein
MTLPNFIIIGAQKAGTTALYRYLEEHPDIYMSPDKEPRFFANAEDRNGVFPYKTQQDYETLFSGVAGQRAIGEASTLYLHSETAPARIKALIPDVRLIALLRNPVERAYSAYNFRVREGHETRGSFRQVLDDELRHVEAHDGQSIYLARGMYATQLARYFALFDRSQIRLYTYERFTGNPGEVLADICDFIGVGRDGSVDTTRKYNVSEIPRNRVARLFVNWMGRQDRLKNILRRVLPDRIYWEYLVPLAKRLMDALRTGNAERPRPMEADCREILLDFYDGEIRRLHELTGLPVDAWLRRDT